MTYKKPSSGGGKYKYDTGKTYGSSGKGSSSQLIQERGNNYNATKDAIESKDLSNLKSQKHYDSK